VNLYLPRVACFLILLFISNFSVGQALLSTIEPNPNSILFQDQVILKWNQSRLESAQTTYAYLLASDSNLTNIVSQSTNLNRLDDTLLNLASGRYYWQVQLIDNNTLIASSKVQQFMVSDILTHTSYSHFYTNDSGFVFDAQNRVYKWLNLADTSRSLVQTDSAARPIVINESSLNNKQVALFDGANDFFRQNSAFSFGELFMLANWEGGNNFQTYHGLLTGSSSYFVLIGDGVSGTRTNFFSNTPVPLINSISSSNFAPLDHYKLINVFRGSAFSAADLQIGKDRGFSNRFWNGGISDIIITANTLNDEDREVINQYLCQKYTDPIELGADIYSNYGVCDSIFNADTSFSKYSWSTNDSTSDVLLEMGKEYFLTVTDKFGCEYVDNIKFQEVFTLPADQLLCLGDTFVWNTGLSSSDYSFLWSDSSTDSLLIIDKQGDYFVQITDSNSCSIRSDTISVRFDSSLLNYDLGPDTALCRGNSIELKNYDSTITQLLWSTGNTSSSQVVDTAGTYTISFFKNGCQRYDTINVSIQGLAPNARFAFDQLCFGDSVSFTDSSSAPQNDSLISFSWDFAGLSNDTTQNPFYSFPDTGNFLVSLNVTTDKGCEDTTSRLVDIKPLPQIDFDVVGNCARRPLQFVSNSSISEGNIQGFSWDFGDSSVSTQQNPIHTYSDFGTFQLKLLAISDQNCSDSSIQNLMVNPTPRGSYQVDGQCLGDSTRLISTATLDSGSIARYTWFANQQVIEDSVARILFLSPGKREVILRTESDSACVSILRDSLEIFNPPIADFIANEPCENDSLSIIDNSQLQGDSIVEFLYSIRNTQYIDSSFDRNPTFSLPLPGNYQLTQYITSAGGCDDSLSQLISLNPDPIASFQIINNNSGAPLTLEVENNSQFASSYQWSSGNGESSNLVEPSFVYQDTGIYPIRLIAISDADCRDTALGELNVLPSLLDAALIDAQIIPGLANDFRIRLQLANAGNNKIEEVLISIQLEGGNGLAEKLELSLFRGQTVSRLLTAVLLKNAPKPSFICLEIESVNAVSDEVSENDRFCLSAFPDKLFLKTYPNPVEDFLQIDFVLIQASSISVSIFDASGRQVRELFVDQFYEDGFHQLNLPLESLNSGIYFLRFGVDGNTNEIKIVKQ